MVLFFGVILCDTHIEQSDSNLDPWGDNPDPTKIAEQTDQAIIEVNLQTNEVTEFSSTDYRGKYVFIKLTNKSVWIEIKISQDDKYKCDSVELCSPQILDEDTNAQDLIKAIKLFMAKYVGGTIQGNENYKKLMYSIQDLAQMINPKIILNQLEVGIVQERIAVNI